MSEAVMVAGSELTELQERLRPMYARLAAHPLYAAFRSVEDLHVFLESHVFAVWDFMSLLKSLQQGLTCVEVPWLPTAHAGTRRLVNEIVFGEESDEYQGEAISHFELYLRAMRECGASTAGVDAMIGRLRSGASIEEALEKVPAAARKFVQSTFRVIVGGRLHEIAAAFTFGREDLIPEMFRGFLRDQNQRMQGRLGLLQWYMERHIEVDGDEHGPMALQMVSELCSDDPVRWREATAAAEIALQARLALWDGILLQIGTERS